jgi:FtsP/CotA-like multicopper oxidase with cupredoxin domain
VAPGDNVFIRVEPGQRYTYRYDIPAGHPAGTFWYHSHVHGAVAEQVFAGLFGALSIAGMVDHVHGVHGARERLMVLSQTEATAAGTMITDADSALGYQSTVVNGRSRPTVSVRPGQVERWRHGGIAHEGITPTTAMQSAPPTRSSSGAVTANPRFTG